MNPAALKTFAPLVRHQLMEAVTQKLDFVLSAKTPDYLATFATQVVALRKLVNEDRSGLIERVAYTWFNRLAALRYLDARGWHPFRSRVLTAASTEETQPEILKLARTGTLPEELRQHVKGGPARLNDLLDGRVPSLDPQSEVYRHLVLAACHFYNALLPDLFERLDDETELLLPDDLLTEQSVVRGFRTEITDEDCAEVEVLGWLYQFYISEKKDTVMGRKAAVPTEDIPAVTQLFTPHWIVRYLVENSLGRLWLLNRPSSRLRERMPYYIEGEPEADFLQISKPEEIRVLDPAVGSGHMLTYAFDLLYAIYEEEGYPPSDIPGLILTHNLYGVDICPRAVQLAELALVLKAREKSRRFFQPDTLVRPGILCMQDVRFREDQLREYVETLDLGDLFARPVMELLHQFEEATTFGSLIQPCVDENGIAFVRAAIEAKDLGAWLFLHETHARVLSIFEQAEYLSGHYHVVIANPPYMGFKQLNAPLKRLGEAEFKEGMRDLFAMFIQRNIRLTAKGGYLAMITMDSWTYGDDYNELRDWIFGQATIHTLAHLGPHAFDEIPGEVVQTAAFVMDPNPDLDRLGIYFRLVALAPSAAKERALLENSNRFEASIRSFLNVPRKIVAYHASEHTLEAFKLGEPLRNFAEAFTGLQTGDNPRFIRFWYEVNVGSIRYGCTSRKDAKNSRMRWFPYVKGSDFRKWYGNNVCVLDWCDDGAEIRAHPSATVRNSEYYFKEGLAYNNISKNFCVRAVDPGFIFDQKNSMFFSTSREQSVLALGLLNSPVVDPFLDILSPKDFNPGSLKIIPVLPGALRDLPIAHLVAELVSLARADWDNFETSWDFRGLPLLRAELRAPTLEASWRNWKAQGAAALHRMQELETENNRLFIGAYGLQDEIKPDVPEDQITLARADSRKDMVAFLSYAVGCMMGRYSLDRPGLILANAGDTLDEHYLSIAGKRKDQLRFTPSEEGIIPVLDGEWFEDDIVARTREFLRATFGEATLRENVRFMEESLGKDLRRYFLTEFYKDHLQNYKKRPIYWLVQSPQKGFSVLIYLHRYTRDTMNLVLNRYLRDYQVKLRNRAAQLAHVLASDGSSTREKAEARKEADKIGKTLHECEEWERQTLLPLAQARIELDLDDGVKVNYLKLGEALAPVAGMESKSED
jgi:hypothetical protein